MAADQPIPQLVPIKVEQTDKHASQPLSNGQITVIVVDANGNEILGTEFNISAQQYQKSYAANPKFKVKKNPLQ